MNGSGPPPVYHWLFIQTVLRPFREQYARGRPRDYVPASIIHQKEPHIHRLLKLIRGGTARRGLPRNIQRTFSGQSLDRILDKFSLQSLVRIEFDPDGRLTQTDGYRGVTIASGSYFSVFFSQRFKESSIRRRTASVLAGIRLE